MKKVNAKVVGVMYNNDKRYGGRNRQDILKEMLEDQGATVLLGAHSMPRKDGSGEATLLYDLKSNQIIGWLNRTESEALTKRNHPKYYLGTIEYHGCYHVNVTSISEKRMIELKEERRLASCR